MKKITYLLFIILFLCVVSSCGLPKKGDIADYYLEYRFELPFDHSISSSTDVRLFKTEYSMEQMKQLINDAGYTASLHENGNVKTILISAVKDEFTYYFIIFDKNRSRSNGAVTEDVYTLSSAVWSINAKGGNLPPVYRFLAPIHILDTTTDSETKKVYSSFDEVANFYRETGKDDVEIDDVNKTIKFWCEGNPNHNWIQGTLVMQYTETETGNYLTFKPAE